MESKVIKAAMLLLACLFFQTAFAQKMERHSGLLLVSEKKSKIIPLGKKVKIWAGEENKVYRAKMLAVDDEFVYLSTGKRLPIKSIRSIRRKRIMFRDVGNASVVTGVATGTALVEGAWDATMNPYEYDVFTNSYREKDRIFDDGRRCGCRCVCRSRRRSCGCYGGGNCRYLRTSLLC